MNGSATTGHWSSHPELGLELLDDLGGGGRRDSVHHRVGEARVGRDPLRQARVHAFGIARERLPGDLAVALDVVARHDRRRCDPAVAASREGLGDQTEHAHVAGLDALDVVAALGDGQRDDAGGRCGQQLDHRLGVVGRISVVDDRPDHPRVSGAVGILQDQGVQPVLGVEDVLHLAIGRHDADPADAPLACDALLQQLVDVHRLMSAMEAADPEMHDAERPTSSRL